MNGWMYLDCEEAVFCQETGAEVARVIHGTTNNGRVLTDDEVDAAGRLIAAAPELLAALTRIVEDVGDGFNCDPDQETLAQCRLAIALATGGRA